MPQRQLAHELVRAATNTRGAHTPPPSASITPSRHNVPYHCKIRGWLRCTRAVCASPSTARSRSARCRRGRPAATLAAGPTSVPARPGGRGRRTGSAAAGACSSRSCTVLAHGEHDPAAVGPPLLELRGAGRRQSAAIVSTVWTDGAAMVVAAGCVRRPTRRTVLTAGPVHLRPQHSCLRAE